MAQMNASNPALVNRIHKRALKTGLPWHCCHGYSTFQVIVPVCVFVCLHADLVKHYFFRLNEQEGSIAWSRSRKGISRTSSKALVLEIHRKPSNTVQNLPKFSPSDLHYFSFWVGTSGGVHDINNNYKHKFYD